MKCPKCGNSDTKVIDSRVIEDNQAIRRRRECEYCSYRFSTFERKWWLELTVIKKDGSRELYDKSKIKKALILAFAKRQISSDKIDTIISQLEGDRSKKKDEISSSEIGDDILALLKTIDPVAYVRFASVYKNFDTLDDFHALLQ